MTLHPVYGDPDISVALDLIRFDETVIETRGVMSRLDESPADVGKAFTRSGRQAWVSTPRRLDEDEIAFLRTGAGIRYRVLATVPLGGPPHWSARLQLQSDPHTP